MSAQEIRAADTWIDEHFIWVIHPRRRPSLDWVLQMLEVAVIRYGACVFVLDPWNRLESSRPPGVTETDYIRDCLVDLDNFAKQMNIHIMILAHPAKTDVSVRGKPPELQDIAGSKHWDNMPDQGFVIFRKKVFEDGKRVTAATIFHKKARGKALGFQCTLEMDFDLSVESYKSIDYKMGYE
jgi:twinkle protein